MASADAPAPVYLELPRPEAVGRLYYYPPFQQQVLYQSYDLECPKCLEGMLLFQAEADGLFGLVAQDCGCRFTQEEATPLEDDVMERAAERCLDD
jgi:hypothetical protein